MEIRETSALCDRYIAGVRAYGMRTILQESYKPKRVHIKLEWSETESESSNIKDLPCSFHLLSLSCKYTKVNPFNLVLYLFLLLSYKIYTRELHVYLL